MLITYFVGDVPERGQGVALKFAYHPDLVATVKHSLREARVAYYRRNRQPADQIGGWVPGIRVWFCPIELWAETARRLEGLGHQLEAHFDERLFFNLPWDEIGNHRTQRQSLPSSTHTTASDWELFGLSPTASPAELKQAYRDLVEVWHPDRFAHNPRLQAKAEAMAKQINAAYQRLQIAA